MLLATIIVDNNNVPLPVQRLTAKNVTGTCQPFDSTFSPVLAFNSGCQNSCTDNGRQIAFGAKFLPNMVD